MNDQALITRHLDLITQVGAMVTHIKDGRTGTLTGRGGWLQVEVKWDSGVVELVKDGLVRVGGVSSWEPKMADQCPLSMVA